MNRKRTLCLLLLVCLCLTGCASLLEREYDSVTLHSAAPAAEEDFSALRVESYQELVNALLYLVTQGEETGVIRLYNYPSGQVDGDLNAACLEVSKEDPLGAYSVDYISSEVSTIVSYFEVDISIRYRRTQEQVASIVAATGSSAIRNQLQQALTTFSDEVVLRIGYFSGDKGDIYELLKQAYFATPAFALGMPDVQIFIYPEQGTRKIVEVLLDYPQSKGILNTQQRALEKKLLSLPLPLLPPEGSEQLTSLLQMLLQIVVFDPEGGETAYSALVDGRADSQGLALALTLVCQKLNLFCQVVEGTRDNSPHFWNILLTPSGYRHVDLTRLDPETLELLEQPEQPEDGKQPEIGPFLSDRTLLEADYQWERQSVPQCGAQPE